MREIKFRAFNYKPIRKMYYEWGLPTLNTFGINSLFLEHINDPNWIIMQYTCLKDKNGKEIYEGDIVKFSENDLMIVVYIDGYYRAFGGLPHSEVIGNIYENPELLKVED